MSMDYCQAESFLFNLCPHGTKLGLSNINHLLDSMGNVQRNLFFIHVAGTNGKGSVCSILNSIFCSVGLRTGVFMSPHLVSLRERIKINNRVIPINEFSACVNRIKSMVEHVRREYSAQPTFFEVLTAMAVDYFYRKNVDIVLWETGMGGEYDSTNIVNRGVSVITNVSLDHCDYLGDTVEQIAKDKSGIIKKKSLFFTASKDKNVLKIFQNVCCKQNTEMIRADSSSIVIKNKNKRFKTFDYVKDNFIIPNLKTNLLASYQDDNLALAINCSQRILAEISKTMSSKELSRCIVRGIKNLKIAGRFQVLQEDPVIIVDSAHNQSGMSSLREAVLDVYSGKKINVIFGVLADKDYRSICSELVRFADRIFCVEPVSDRKLSAEKLAVCCTELADEKIDIVSNLPVHQVLESFCRKCYKRSDEVLVVCGSFYLVGEVIRTMGKSKIKIMDNESGYR